MENRKSGQMVAADHVATLARYLAVLKSRAEPVPTRADGQLNLTKIAKDSGLKDRGRFYTNAKLMAMVEAALLDSKATTATRNVTPDASLPGSESIGDVQQRTALKRAERQLHRLEQANAALTAENADLRRQLKTIRMQLGREDMIIETGRRVPPSGAQ